MDEWALHGLTSTDWGAGCAAPQFCFVCASPVCFHCCNEHRQRHHGEKRPEVVQAVYHVGGAPALLAEGVRGCGYDMTGIQRVRSGGRKYVLLCPVNVDDLRCHNHCRTCQHRIKRGADWCSVGCKAEVALGGRHRDAARRLAEMAEAGHFGAPVHLKNRFCIICGLAFCSSSCPAHAQRHHPAANPGPDSVKTVVHVDGWAAVPAGQLPAEIVENVQALHRPDGSLLYPIHSRQAQAHAAAAIHQLGVGGAHACQRPDCGEVFLGPEAFCSIRCRHQAAD